MNRRCSLHKDLCTLLYSTSPYLPPYLSYLSPPPFACLPARQPSPQLPDRARARHRIAPRAPPGLCSYPGRVCAVQWGLIRLRTWYGTQAARAVTAAPGEGTLIKSHVFSPLSSIIRPSRIHPSMNTAVRAFVSCGVVVHKAFDLPSCQFRFCFCSAPELRSCAL